MYIPILMVGAFFSSVVGLYSAIYVAKKMTKQVASTSIFAALINIVITVGLITFIGLYAAAIASAVAYLAMAVYRHYDVKKYVTITYEKNLFVKIAAVYALSIALYYYNNLIGNIANALIITIVVIVFNKSMIKVIKNKVFAIGSRRKNQPLNPDQEVQEELL
jgi:O-antigen/teichoic acid export membrane protein